MIDKPDAANYAMDTRGRILIKTIMEIVDMVENYIEWNPKLEWLSPKEREYINDYGFRYTKDEKKKTWKINGGGVGDYMSDWYIWITGKEKIVNLPRHRC